ncbi:MAG: NADH-quinone oxidoreductase subunit A [Methylococcaceae bacterium]|nr:NADH-quinone oxidoreductase subunit A [Prolixibacteraceae bacterium]
MEQNTLSVILLEEPLYFWPFLVYTIAAFVIVTVMIGLSYLLGERHKGKATDDPFESGIPPTGGARLRFSSHFYLIAMFFVIFDLDAAFIMVWAVSFRELGIAGYLGVSVFILVFVVVLIYELGIGALNFGPNGKKILQSKMNRK